MKIRVSILLLFAVLISCQKKEIPENEFVGIWNDTEYIIPNKTTIKINKDSTFNYRGAGCQWLVISRGKWKMIGDSIELNSIKSDTCYKMFPFVDCIRFGENRRKDILTVPNCNPKGDTDFLIFDKERFYLKNDSLIYKLKRSSKCPNTLKIVFAKTQKNRK